MSSRKDKFRICIGVITGAKGIKGELRIKPLTQTPRNVAAYGPVETEDGTRRLVINKVEVSGKGIVVQAEGITTRTDAEALKGIRLYVPKAALPQIDEGEYYQADLIGLKVTSKDGTEIGDVVALQDFGAGDLLEIRLRVGCGRRARTESGIRRVDAMWAAPPGATPSRAPQPV